MNEAIKTINIKVAEINQMKPEEKAKELAALTKEPYGTLFFTKYGTAFYQAFQMVEGEDVPQTIAHTNNNVPLPIASQLEDMAKGNSIYLTDKKSANRIKDHFGEQGIQVGNTTYVLEWVQ